MSCCALKSGHEAEAANFYLTSIATFGLGSVTRLHERFNFPLLFSSNVFNNECGLKASSTVSAASKVTPSLSHAKNGLKLFLIHSVALTVNCTPKLPHTLKGRTLVSGVGGGEKRSISPRHSKTNQCGGLARRGWNWKQSVSMECNLFRRVRRRERSPPRNLVTTSRRLHLCDGDTLLNLKKRSLLGLVIEYRKCKVVPTKQWIGVNRLAIGWFVVRESFCDTTPIVRRHRQGR
ncbi:hypothetical protein NPIL_583471 [Nephila pilipes]|uniref:Uncharacterized protein n=1 Tax=Nephila pilipes TaxID=299642 RepID=A0A8X6UDF5_NEPPI|nr:hypothetical protein NPIL_583471 [Nephila pilipes]